MKYFKLILYICLSGLGALTSLSLYADVPVIGAQVFIEPGQTDEEIEHWFKLLHDSNMPVCRIRMFEDYMKDGDREWDFTLFDKAFRAAEKYNVCIFATLFPSTPDNSIGGFKFPESQEHEEQVAVYIEKVVNHFRQFRSLYGWVLINEPGTGGGVPRTEYTNRKFEAWKQQQTSGHDTKGYTLLKNFDREKFLLDYNTWYLQWIADEISKYDKQHHIHVNNHQIFENVAEYDFPAWRNFLSSLGASAHPSWHFGYFERQQFAAALAANCQIIRSGAGKIPFWVTELQGGNNTYSGYRPFCPTKEEITQWLWTSIGCGAEGIIFWCLNPRSIGEEAGEWALVNFQNQPSDRMIAASEVATTLMANKDFFTNAKAVDSRINILYTRESLWVEKECQYGDANDKDFEGRLPGGVMKSALAFYEILLENGINANFSEANEFDWKKNDYTGDIIILANQISLPSVQWDNIRNFVRKGGKLIVEGLSGFFDENMLSLHNTGFPLQDVFGGALQEVKATPGDFMADFPVRMPIHLWEGTIYNITGTPVWEKDNSVFATRNSFGKGEVVWVPSLIGLGARRTGNSGALSEWLVNELKSTLRQLPFYFSNQQKGVLMHTLTSKKQFATILSNKNKDMQQIDIHATHTLKPRIIFSNGKGQISDRTISLEPEETLVILWR